MHWMAFIAACLALLLVRLLRAPGKTARMTAGMWFGASLIITIFAIRVFSESAEITRPTEYDAFIRHAADQAASDPDAPIALFVDASFSRNALNDDQMTDELRALGYPHRVINLSLHGASLQERDEHLWEFMRYTGRAPDVVFLGVAEEFDVDPVYAFTSSKFSDRAIKQFSPEGVFWSMKGLSQGQCEGKVGCIKSWVLLKLHAAMNWSNLGLLATGKSLNDIEPEQSYDPQDVPRTSFQLTLDEVRDGLETPVNIQPEEGPTWARLFRIDQRKRLLDAGVRRVAYYTPPVIDPQEREYVADLCAGELMDYTCIAPTDPDMLEQLAGNNWFDEKHLLRGGAAVYTNWLAGQIEARGALQ